ncbi:MAG: hypothetical protein ABUT20_51265, partial [Bacteroidota bacterium]
YYWFYHSDVNKAIGYFDKYAAVTDPKPSDEYDRISFLYAAKKYQDCITQSQQKISALGAKADPRYYKLIAYCYSDQGDSSNAKTYLEQYFSKQKPDGFVAQDYSFLAEVLNKFPGNDSLVSLNYQKAFDTDTAQINKEKIAEEAAAAAKSGKYKTGVAKWEGVLYHLNKNPGQAELYRWGIANYQAGNYPLSDSIFCTVYESKYANEIYGYLWCARSKRAQDDSANTGGLAVDAYLKLADEGKALDSMKYKNQIIEAYFYLASYNNDIKKDKNAAISYLQKVVDVDPTNTQAKQFIEILSKPPAKQPAQKPKAKSGGK